MCFGDVLSQEGLACCIDEMLCDVTCCYLEKKSGANQQLAVQRTPVKVALQYVIDDRRQVHRLLI